MCGACISFDETSEGLITLEVELEQDVCFLSFALRRLVNRLGTLSGEAQCRVLSLPSVEDDVISTSLRSSDMGERRFLEVQSSRHVDNASITRHELQSYHLVLGVVPSCSTTMGISLAVSQLDIAISCTIRERTLRSSQALPNIGTLVHQA